MEFKPNGKLSFLWTTEFCKPLERPPLTMTSLAIHIQTRQCRLKTYNDHVNSDATDETKIVMTKFVLGFCHGQLRFCLLVRIGPYWRYVLHIYVHVRFTCTFFQNGSKCVINISVSFTLQVSRCAKNPPTYLPGGFNSVQTNISAILA